MDVGEWLRSLGLSRYEEAFREAEIGPDVLADLTGGDLEKLGVPLGDRKRLLKAIASFGPAQMVAEPRGLSPTPSSIDAAERRQLTVMFCDLVGSTAISTRLDPEDMREVIAAYQKCVSETVRRFGGFVAKYMGDGVLAYFGYPRAHEHDAERAVRAGLAIVEAAPTLQTAAGAPLHVRVGLATGIVIVGDLLGSGEAQERGVVGGTPNLAARLQGIAEPDSVVIAESTRKLLGELFELVDLGPQKLKGVGGPTLAFAALRESSQANRFEALHPGGLAALVGRDAECELLLRLWAKAKGGRGQVALISGEAGIGKSRLTAEFLERLPGEPHTRLRYFCSPQHSDSALYPVIGHIERAANFAREDDAKTRLDKLEAVLSVLNVGRGRCASGRDAVPSERRPLSHIGPRPAPTAAENACSVGPPDRRDCARNAGADGLRGRPLGRSFEPGSHWPARGQDRGLATPAVRHLPAGIRPAVGRASACDGAHDQPPRSPRSDSADRPGRRRQATCGKYPARHRRARRRNTLVCGGDDEGGAGGRGRGRGGTHGRFSAVSRTGRSASLHASLMARLDRLGPAKAVAQIGAAIGREFSHALLVSITGETEPELAASLDRLLQSGLLSREGTPPHAMYLFKHALVQDAAYGTLLREPRRALHARIAGAIEEQFPEVAESQPETLARHCTEAGQIEKAASLWGKAGQRSLGNAAFPEAEGQLTRALAQITSLPSAPTLRREQIKLQVGLSYALMQTKGYGASETKTAFELARVLIQRAEALGEPAEDPLALFSILYGVWVWNFAAFNSRRRSTSQDSFSRSRGARRNTSVSDRASNNGQFPPCGGDDRQSPGTFRSRERTLQPR